MYWDPSSLVYPYVQGCHFPNNNLQIVFSFCVFYKSHILSVQSSNTQLSCSVSLFAINLLPSSSSSSYRATSQYRVRFLSGSPTLLVQKAYQLLLFASTSIMANPKLGRIPSMRERVEDTLSVHRNELVSLLCRFFPCAYTVFTLLFYCLVPEKPECIYFFLFGISNGNLLFNFCHALCVVDY